MSLLSANDAAIIASTVYTVLDAGTNADALKRAERDQRFAGMESPGTGDRKLSGPMRPVAGMVGRSGAFIKDTTGFGVVLERGAGHGREMIVAFRGTQTLMFDWVSNFNIGLAPGPQGSLVHAGFLEIYRSMREELGRVLTQAKPSKVHFVGHSLGGALASIAAVDFIGSGAVPGNLYTFGAPRVGTMGLMGAMRRCLPETNVRRVYALSDPVPMIPMMPFLHYGPGSIGKDAGFSTVISFGAHSMKDSYIPNMPATGWPPMMALPNRADPKYWLNEAEKAGSLHSAFGYFCLSRALSLLMPVLSAGSGLITLAMTPIDILANALARGARSLVSRIGDTILHFVRAALKIVGVAVNTAMTIADITETFLRWVLNLLFTPVQMAAKIALNKLS